MFRTVRESRDELPTTEVLKVKIVEDYEGRRSRDTNISQGAMYVRKQQRPHTNGGQSERSETGGQRNKNKVGNVFVVVNTGNFARDCYAKGPVQSRQSARQLEDKDDESVCSKTSYCDARVVSGPLSTTAEAAMHSCSRSNEWCFDSGSTDHLCNNKNIITDLKTAGH